MRLARPTSACGPAAPGLQHESTRSLGNGGTQKTGELSDDFLGRIFHDVVPGTRDAVTLRIRPVRAKPLEAFRAEAPIAHAPNQEDLSVSQ